MLCIASHGKNDKKLILFSSTLALNDVMVPIPYSKSPVGFCVNPTALPNPIGHPIRCPIGSSGGRQGSKTSYRASYRTLFLQDIACSCRVQDVLQDLNGWGGRYPLLIASPSTPSASRSWRLRRLEMCQEFLS